MNKVKNKKIAILVILSSVLLISAVCLIAFKLKNIDNSHVLPINMVQTTERNFIEGYASVINLQQDFMMTHFNLIFKGKYVRSENYTIDIKETLDDEEIEFEEYYTYYYFMIDKIYVGKDEIKNKNWEKTEFPIIVKNYNAVKEHGEIILEENEEYILFCQELPYSAYKETNRWSDYTIGLSQTVFEVNNDSVTISKDLFGYNDRDEVVYDDVKMFMKSWIEPKYEKSINRNGLSVDDSADDRIIVNEKEDLSSWSIDDYASEKLLSVFNLNKTVIDSTAGEKERIIVSNELFEDFLSEARKHYIGVGKYHIA